MYNGQMLHNKKVGDSKNYFTRDIGNTGFIILITYIHKANSIVFVKFKFLVS